MQFKTWSRLLLLLAVLVSVGWSTPARVGSSGIEGACTSFCLDNG